LKVLLGIFCCIISISTLAEESVAPSNVYQLDLFSLISFGLAITALVVSVFMAWLSWEFYKKSSQTSETTNETVTRIETSIVGIQNDISEIVQRAVGHWINGNGDSNLSEIKSEFQEKLSDLEDKLNENSTVDSPDITPELSALKEQMFELSKGVREAQVKALFPNMKDDKSPILVRQSLISKAPDDLTGQVIITLNKPMKYATGTGKFSPRFTAVPDFSVELLDTPYENTDEVKFSQGVGTPADFNIHLNGKGGFLKAGDYTFRYNAKYVA